MEPQHGVPGHYRPTQPIQVKCMSSLWLKRLKNFFLPFPSHNHNWSDQFYQNHVRTQTLQNPSTEKEFFKNNFLLFFLVFLVLIVRCVTPKTCFFFSTRIKFIIMVRYQFRLMETFCWFKEQFGQLEVFPYLFVFIDIHKTLSKYSHSQVYLFIHIHSF